MKKYEKHAYFEFQTTKKLLSTALSFNRLLHMKLPLIWANINHKYLAHYHQD